MHNLGNKKVFYPQGEHPPPDPPGLVTFPHLQATTFSFNHAWAVQTYFQSLNVKFGL